jgi:MFS transporter, OFA family, oxalate/formate antiporter
MMNRSLHTRLPFGLPNIFYGWWIVSACSVLSLYTGGVIFYGFTAFFDPLVKEFGWSYTQVSFAMSLRGLEMSFLAPLAGFLVDRYGPRKLTFWGAFAIGLGFLCLSQTQSLWMFYASFILIAFGGGGCAAVVFMRVASNWFQRKVGLAFGVLNSGLGASGLVVPLIVYLIDTMGWRTAVIILGLGMWVIGIPLTFIIRDNPEDCGLYPDGRKTEPPPVGTLGMADEGGEDIRFLDAVKHRAFLFLVLSDFLRMTAVASVVTHIVPYLSAIQIPRTKAGLIAGSITLLSISGRFGFGWLSDRLDTRNIMVVAFTMLSLGLFSLCYVQNPWVLFLFLFIFPVGLGATVVLRGAFLREYFGRRAFGRLLGLSMGAASVGGIIGPTLTGLIFDRMGSYAFAWNLFGTCSLLSVLFIFFIGSKPGATRLPTPR